MKTIKKMIPKIAPRREALHRDERPALNDENDPAEERSPPFLTYSLNYVWRWPSAITYLSNKA
jgi:hypothetical protein